MRWLLAVILVAAVGFRLVSLSSGDHRSRVDLARRFLSGQDWALIAELQARPIDASEQLCRGTAFLRQGELESAALDFDTGSTRGIAEAELVLPRFFKASTEFRRGNRAEAQCQWELVVIHAPPDIIGRALRTLALEVLGRGEESRQELRQSAKLDELRRMRSAVLAYQGEYLAALQESRAAEEIPLDPFYSMGEMCLFAGEFSQAANVFKAQAALGRLVQPYPDTHAHAAWAAYLAGDLDTVRQELAQSSSALAHATRGEMALDQGRLDQALQELEQAAQAEPDNPFFAVERDYVRRLR